MSMPISLWISILMFLGASCFSAASSFQSATEWFATGDFDGDGQTDVVMADRETGVFRIGYGQAGGSYVWSMFHPSGISPIDSVTVGKLVLPSRDSVAFSGRQANRMNVFPPSAPGAPFAPPISGSTNGIGPTAIAVGGSGNLALEHVLAITENGASGSLETLLNVGERFIPAWVSIERVPAHSFFPLQWTLSQPRGTILTTDLASGVGGMLAAIQLENAAWRGTMLSQTAKGVEGAGGQFLSGEDYGQIVLLQPGADEFEILQLGVDSEDFLTIQSRHAHPLPFPTRKLFTLPDAGGKDLLLALNVAGTEAVVIQFINLLNSAIMDTFAMNPGFITGLANDGAGGFTLFGGSALNGPSDRYDQYGLDGGTFFLLASDSLSPFPSVTSFPSSLVLFDVEVLVDDDAKVIGRIFAGDWTRETNLFPALSAVVESFGGETSGLGGAVSRNLGSVPAGVQYALANQYLPHVSISSLEAPRGMGEVSAFPVPAPGEFATSILLSFPTANPSLPNGTDLFYREGPGGAWKSYQAPFWIYQNVTLEWVARDGAGNSSRIFSGDYTISTPPHALDSDGDGIPDFVKIHLGLDPFGGSGAEGDGLSHLEKLLFGDDAGLNPFPSGAAFDALLRLRPLNHIDGNHTNVLPGVALHAYSPSGDLLSTGTADADDGFYPAILLDVLDFSRSQPFFSVGTVPHFDIDTGTSDADPRSGREIVALLSPPALDRPVVNYIFGGGDLETEANLWTDAARIAYSAYTSARLTADLSPTSIFHGALVEHALANALRLRRGNPAERFTAFPFRTTDTGHAALTRSMLLTLAQSSGGLPAYRADMVMAEFSQRLAGDEIEAVALREFADEVYRLTGLHGVGGLGKHVLPLETFRYFLDEGMLPAAYDDKIGSGADQLSPSLVQVAADTVADWLGNVSQRPRVHNNGISLEITESSIAAGCTVLLHSGSGVSYALLRADGSTFRLPGNLVLAPGTQMTVQGYTDVLSPCAAAAIEVTAIFLSSISTPSDSDTDGNLLPDTWEGYFFGNTGVNPFTSSDGSGFSTLQQFLEGTDPTSAASVPSGLPVDLSPPRLQISSTGDGGMKIAWDWPDLYASHFRFRVHTSTDLQNFSPLFLDGIYQGDGSNRFQVSLPPTNSASRFYRVEMELK